MEEFRDYGMREYKAPLSLRIKNFFFTHPIMVAVLVAIIISLFMGGCDKARAETIPQYVQDIYDSYIDEATNIGDENKQAVKDYIDTFEYSYMAEFLNSTKTAVQERIIYLTNYSNMGFCSWFGWNNYGSQFFNGTRTNGSRWEEGGVTLPDSITVSNAYYSAIIITYNTNNINLYCNKFVPQDKVQKSTYSVWLYYSHYRTTGVTNVPVFPTDSLPYNYSNHGDASYIKCYLYEGSDSLRYFYSSEYDRFSGIKNMKELSNIVYFEAPPTNNTAGFDCYKLDTKGGIYFIADYSSLVTFDHSTSNTSTFSCDIHLDDTTQTITLDSTSEYYIYDVDHREAEYSFPVTAFVPNYTEYQHVWIDNVKVVNTYSGHGGSADSTFVYITPIDILGSFPEEELEPSEIPQVTPVPDNLEGYGIDYHSGEELKTLYDNNMFNQWITESEFYSDIAQLGGGRSVKLVGATDQNVTENNTDNTLAYLSNVAAILSGTADVPGTGAVMTVVYGVNAFFDTINAPRNNGQIDFNGAAEDYIRDNLYSSTYDIIVLQAYYDAEALQTNSNDLLYTPIPSIDDLHAGEPYAGKIFYVILTQRYIESLNLDGLGSIQKLLESDVYYAKSTYEYLYDRLNDFEDKSLDGLKDIAGVENNILDKLNNVDTFIQRIEGVLNRILNALSDLHLSQLDAIDTDLDTIITKLNTIASRDPNEYDTVEEAIAYYKANNDDGLPDSSVFMENRFSLWFSGKVHDWWSSMNHNGGDAQHPTASLLGSTFDALKTTYESMTSETKILDNIIYFVNSFSDDDPDDVDTTYMTGLFKDNFDIDAYNGAEVSNE